MALNPKKHEMPTQAPEVRARNFSEVALGYTLEMAEEEAKRCLNCKNRPCVAGCPVNVDIPGFIMKIKEGDFEGAYQVINETSSLPAVCGRVCPQETQCESKCSMGVKFEPVGIGRLERFVADHHNANAAEKPTAPAKNGHRVAIDNDIVFELVRDDDGLVDITVKREGETVELRQVPFVMTEGEDGKKAYEFVSQLTKLMGVQVDIRIIEEENQVFVDINGDTLGVMIGRRGETLDAAQYLTSPYVNRDKNEYTRVTLDVEHYRAKREETLVKLANRMANRARKSGRRVVLEPMNPYERRVLHSALQQNPYVTTHSEGEDPYRRVIITLK